METTLRNASLADLSELLTRQADAKIDVVVPADQITASAGDLIVPGVRTFLTPDGVDSEPGALVPTAVCDGTIADRFGIPIKYLRSLRERGSRLLVPCADTHYEQALLDATLNAHFQSDDKTVLVRGFREDGPTPGIARAVLSDSYKLIDNLDALTAVLDGARRASASVQVQKVDLSERAMRVHFIAPEITALAPRLLEGYRPPSDTQPYGTVGGLPIVFAGIVASNSETGGGAFQIAPRFVIQWCSNGATRQQDAVRAIHLGAKLDPGGGPLVGGDATEERRPDRDDGARRCLDVPRRRLSGLLRE